MEWKYIILNDNVSPYKISEYGDVYSLRKNRLLKGGYNSLLYPYRFYCLQDIDGKRQPYYAHWLVHKAFIGPIPEGYEVDHDDMDKDNNHYSNLKAVTKSENMRKARIRKHWNSGRKPGFKHTQKTKNRMAKAKHKPINIILEGHIMHQCQSIEEATQYLDTYRKRVYRALQSGGFTRFKANTYILQYA